MACINIDAFNCLKLPIYSYLMNLQRDYQHTIQFPYFQKSLFGFYQNKIHAKQEKAEINEKSAEHLPNLTSENKQQQTSKQKENIPKKKFNENRINIYFDDFPKLVNNLHFQKNMYGFHQTIRKIENEERNLSVNEQCCLRRSKERAGAGAVLERGKVNTQYSYNACEKSKAETTDRLLVADISKLYCLHCDYQLQTSSTYTQFGIYEGLYQTVHGRKSMPEDILGKEHLKELRTLILESYKLVVQYTEGDEYDSPNPSSDVARVIEKNSDVEEFKQSYVYLDTDALLEVEYLVDDDSDWQFMLQENGNDIFCNLCKCTVVANTPNIVAHLRSWNHRNIVKRILALYHPTYCTISDDEESEDSETVASSLYRSRALNEGMSLEEFKRKYIDMDIYNLLDILFLNNSHKWVNMFDEKEYKYICNLCNKIQLKNFYDVQEHIRDSRHSQQVNLVEALYHPIYLQASIDNIYASDIRLNEIVNSRTNISKVNIKEQKVEDIEKTDKQPQSLDFFKSGYRKLAIPNLLVVQYSMNFRERQFMISFQNDRYFCNLCGKVPVGDSKNLRTHIKGTKHSKKMECIVEIYDPLNSVWINNIRPGENGQLEKNDLNAEIENPSSLDLFKYDYRWLHTKNLLKIKYSLNLKDKKLMFAGTEDQYYCNLCGCCRLGNIKNVLAHIKEFKHTKKVESVVEMYDPIAGVWLKKVRENANGRGTNNVVSKQRNISPNNFKSEYIHLGIANLLKIEYKLENSNAWTPMICQVVNCYGVYGCNLCDKISLGSGEKLRRHIRSDLHRKKVAKIQNISHPKYCPKQKSKGNQLSKSTHGKQINIKQSKQNVVTNWVGMPNINAKQFKLTYTKLPLNELLKVQYQLDNKPWEFMLNEENERYFCNLCGNVPLGTEHNVRVHIEGQLHSNKVRNFLTLHHPKHSNYFDSKTPCNEQSASAQEKTDSQCHCCQKETDPVLEEFKKNYVNLKIEELLKIQYPQDSGDWEYLLTEKSELYFCNLCGNVQLGPEWNVKTHIRGRSHSGNISKLTALYHPEYCVLSDEDCSESYEDETSDDKVECDSVLEEFKKNYVNLKIEELLKIQYPQDSDDWEYMLTEKSELYFCNLCGNVQLGTECNVNTHIRGRSHSGKISKLTALYHPEYCVLSDEDCSESYKDETSDDEVECDSVLEPDDFTKEANVQKDCAVYESETNFELLKPNIRSETLDREISDNDFNKKNKVEGRVVKPSVSTEKINLTQVPESRFAHNGGSTRGMAENEQITSEPLVHPVISENKKDEFDTIKYNFENFIRILRQLSAFQDIYGAIAPLTTDLLTEALILQKASSDSARSAFLNDKNMLFVQTAREKLRGLIELDLIENPKILLAAKKLINIISAFMQDEK